MEVLFASHNEHKAKEIKAMLEGTGIDLITLKDLGDLDLVKETGETFTDNALIKAKYFWKKYHMPVLADDSGLIVEVLGNRPGVYSSRYSGSDATDYKNNQKLLDEMKNENNRVGRFMCIICYIQNGKYYMFEGKLEGRIATNMKEEQGFGYDPIFIAPNGKRLSQMSLQAKNKISHRANALQKWLQFILKEKTTNE
ncbi:MAG: RdgB/HAM1 family non-canonical purine NTP pyrophosphatase [Bacilli bacterium]